MSMTRSAPLRSFIMQNAVCSAIVPSGIPGKMRFMSRSKLGIPLFRVSMPRGFNAGYISTVPSSRPIFSFMRFAIWYATSCPSSSSPCVPVTMHSLCFPLPCESTFLRMKKCSSAGNAVDTIVFIIGINTDIFSPSQSEQALFGLLA